MVDRLNSYVIVIPMVMPDLALFLVHKLFPSCHFKLVRTLHNTVLWNSWGKIGRIVEKYIQHENANVSNSIAVSKSYVDKYGGKADIPLIYNGFKPSSQTQYSQIIEGIIF